MAERIKGLQIDFTMDTSKVSKSMAQLKREFRGMNSSLKVNNNNLKFGAKTQSDYRRNIAANRKTVRELESNLQGLDKQIKQVDGSQSQAKKQKMQIEYNRQADALNAMKGKLAESETEYRTMYSTLGRTSTQFTNIGTSMTNIGTKSQKVGQSLTNSVTKPALAAGAALAGVVIAKGWGRLVEIDTAKAKLGALGNSSKEVTSIMDNAMEAVKGTSFSMGEAATTAANATAAGIKPGKELTQYLTTTGDAAAIAGTDMSEMGRIFNKVQTQNKAYNGELQELSDRGLPIYQWLAKEAGVTGEEVTEMASKGEISSKMLQDAVRKNIGGAAKEMGQKSFTASVSNMWAAVGRLGASFLDAGGKGGGFFSKIKPLMNNLTSTLDTMGPKAEQWGKALGGAFTKVANGVQSVKKWFDGLPGPMQSVIGSMVKWGAITLVVLGPMLTMFSKMTLMTGKLFSGVGLLTGKWNAHRVAQGKATVQSKIWNGVTKVGRGIALAAKGTVNGLGNAYKWLAVTQNSATGKTRIGTAATKVWSATTKVAAVATKGLGLAIRFMTGPVGIVITAVGLLVAAIIHLWKTNATFRKNVIGAWNAIKKGAVAIFGAISKGVKAIWSGMVKGVMFIVKHWKQILFAQFYIMRAVIPKVFRVIKASAIKIWTSLKNGVVKLAKGLFNGAKNAFVALGKAEIKIFNSIKNFAIKIWTKVKNYVVTKAKQLYTGAKNAFIALGKAEIKIFNSIKNFAIKIWTKIKNFVVTKAKQLWTGVRNMFNGLGKSTRSIFNSVKNFLIKLWTNIRNKTVGLAKTMWSKISGTWQNLKKGTANLFGKVHNATIGKWKSMTGKLKDLTTGMKTKIIGVMGKMRDGIKKITDKIGDFFGGMIKGVKTGLNKLIDGVNWVGSKLSMDKIKHIKLHTGTGGSNSGVVRNGKIARDTFATVGDKGKGNGPGGFRHEAIRYPNGKMALTPNRDTKTFLPKGSTVMNGAQTHSMLSSTPAFASGTGGMFDLLGGGNKPKKKKHDEHNDADESLGDKLGNLWGGTKNAGSSILEGGKNILSGAVEQAKKGKNWFKDKIGDVMDWIDKPGKLLNKVLEGFGMDFNSFGIGKSAALPHSMMKGAYKKLKESAIATFKQLFEDQGGDGDGGYIKYLDNITTPYSPGGPPPGYPFGWAHPGIDLPYKYEPVYSTISGTAHRKEMPGGFGHYMQVNGGGLEVIYGHLSKQIAKNNSKVKPGDKLGISGNSGASTGPHLHYEMHKNGKPIDPVKWLKSHQGGGSKSASKWKGDIRRAAKATGVSLSGGKLNDIVRLIQTESNGNPRVTQHGYTDVNSGGNEARGLLQYTPGTFKSYATKKGKNILNGYHQLKAFFNNSNWSGDLATWKSRMARGLTGWGPSGSNRGYATGGLIKDSGFYNLAEGGYPEFVIPTDPSRQSDAMKLLAIASQQIEGNGAKNKRPAQMRAPHSADNSGNSNEMAQLLQATLKQNEILMKLLNSSKNIEDKPTGFNEENVSKAQGRRSKQMNYYAGGAF